MHRNERSVADYRKLAKDLAEAIEKQQAAARSASLWQSLLEKSNDKYVRIYFQGQVDLSKLREFHSHLVARACQEAAHGRVLPGSAKSVPVLAIPGGDRTHAEWDAHNYKAAAFSLLAECSWRLGMQRMAESYETRARLEDATARVHDRYAKKPETDASPLCDGQTPDLTRGYHHLQSAGRSLGEFNIAYAKVMAHMRSAREFETAIEKLESAAARRLPNPAEIAQFAKAKHQLDIATRFAEEEALQAIFAGRSFQTEIQMARNEYEALSPKLTGKALESNETTSEIVTTSENRHETQGDLQGPGRTDSETKITETSTRELDQHETDAHPAQAGADRTIAVNPHLRKVAVSVVVSQVLRELDRGM